MLWKSVYFSSHVQCEKNLLHTTIYQATIYSSSNCAQFEIKVGRGTRGSSRYVWMSTAYSDSNKKNQQQQRNQENHSSRQILSLEMNRALHIYMHDWFDLMSGMSEVQI